MPDQPQDQQGPFSHDEQEIELDSSAQAQHIQDRVSQIADATNTTNDILDEIISMSEDKFLPWEEFTLPSKGLYYGGAVPGGRVRVRPMGIHAEKIMATQRLAATGQSIDYLLKHCVELPGKFDHDQLLSGDRMFLLYVLRGITHGNMYEFSIKCPSCETSSLYKYDLNELAQTITQPDESLGLEPFRIDLPHLSSVLNKRVWVKVRFFRGYDTSSVMRDKKFKKRLATSAKAKNKKGGKTDPRDNMTVAIDDALTQNLSLIVVAVGSDGQSEESTSRHKINQMVDRLHSLDSAKIREFLREHSPGIDTAIELECPHCGFEFSANLPINENFFRPTGD